MPELNPRPNKPNLFVQVSVAVISGAAVMYVVQNFSDAPVVQRFLFTKAAPQAAAKAPEPEKHSLPERPVPTAEDLQDINAVKGDLPKPAASSMMVVPEPGGREAGILGVGDDESMLEPEKPQEPGEPERPKPKTLSATGAPVVRLSETENREVIGGMKVGKGFGSSGMHLHQFAQKEAAPPPVVRTVKPKPRTRHYTRVFEKTPIPRKDLFMPGMLDPDAPPEKVFWDESRKRNVILAGLVALCGVFYLLFGTGAFGVGKRRAGDFEKT
ncbi:MAG: hypothetical protein ACHQ51_01565 [Elusimicrobiota bacterium]